MSTPTIRADVLIDAHAALLALERRLVSTKDEALYVLWGDTMKARVALGDALRMQLPDFTITPPLKAD